VDGIRGEPAVEFASMRRAKLNQSQSLQVSGCAHMQFPESRSSGAIRSGRAVAEVEQCVSAAGDGGWVPVTYCGLICCFEKVDLRSAL